MFRKLVIIFLLIQVIIPLYAQKGDTDVIIYVQRLKKSTNSDKDYQVLLNDRVIGILRGVNPAVSSESKGEWIVGKSMFEGKFYLVITDNKNKEVDRITIESFPGRSYFVEFNPAAGYGVKPLRILTNYDGKKSFSEAIQANIQIINPEIADRIWASKSKIPDPNEPDGGNTSSQVAETVNFDPATLTGRSEVKVESTLGTEFQAQVNKGNYYALVIGIEDYLDPKITDLNQPVEDAKNIANVLTTFYTFQNGNVTLLTNPKRQQITKSLDDLVDKVGAQDNLLIFYAGHGYWDEKLKQGYWLPSDASEGNRGSWFSNADLKTYIGGINARHTLLITDACFGGAIFKTREAFNDASSDINELYKYPSRKAMTSGALNAVPDKSVFIKYLLDRLKTNPEKYLSSEHLFSKFKTAVINNSPNNQIPQFGEISETGDEGGDFIFIRK